jgi:glycosyltransferase involved in cell wall biosynthesis
MSQPLRVLSLYEGFFAGGARILHSDVVAGLHTGDAQVHSALAIASSAVRDASVQALQDDPRYRRLVADGVAVRTLGRTTDGTAPDPDAFTLDELIAARAAIAEADLVLSLKEQPVGLLLALHRRGMLPEVPVLVCLHRSDPMHAGPALSWLVEAVETGIVEGIVSCAASTEAAYVRAGVHAPRRTVIANGIDTARFRPMTRTVRARTKDALGIPADAPVVLFAARFDAMKDPGLFLAAVAEHAAGDARTHYVMCGSGMTADNPVLGEMMRDAGIRDVDRVHRLGIRDDMPALYAAADIVALTSAFGEASPLCLAEGAACGATPVTTDVGDAAQVVAGIGVVTAHRATDIAGAWREVLADRSARRAIALAARPRLDRARMIAEYRGFLDDIVVPVEAVA